jgi:hypothetical protein
MHAKPVAARSGRKVSHTADTTRKLTITRGPPKVGQIFFPSVGCGIDPQDCSYAPRLAWCVYCCVFASHSSLILLSGKS